MVAMNPQTWDKDVAEIEPGGYLFYDSTRPMPPSKFRDDINVARHAADRDLQRSAYHDPRQRQLFKNIIYVGALAGCWASSRRCSRQLIGEQFKGKDAADRAQHRGAAHGP